MYTSKLCFKSHPNLVSSLFHTILIFSILYFKEFLCILYMYMYVYKQVEVCIYSLLSTHSTSFISCRYVYKHRKQDIKKHNINFDCPKLLLISTSKSIVMIHKYYVSTSLHRMHVHINSRC